MKKPNYYFCEYSRVSFYFMIGWKREDAKKFMLKNYNYNPDLNCTGCCISNYVDGNFINFIWTLRKTDIPVIAHECFHAMMNTQEHIGAVMDYDNQEPPAYMIESLVRKALCK